MPALVSEAYEAARLARIAANRKQLSSIMGGAAKKKRAPELLIRCQWCRTTRVVELVNTILRSQDGADGAADAPAVVETAGPPPDVQASTVHRGWAILRPADGGLLSTVARLRQHPTFERTFTSAFPTTAAAATLEDVAAGVLAHGALPGGASPRLRLHAFDAEGGDAELMETLSALIEGGGGRLSPTEFDACAIVVRRRDAEGRLGLRHGVLTAAEYEAVRALSPEERSAGADVLCRAAFKVLDALQLLADRGVPIDVSLPAIDVGASPGGWTQALLKHGFARVVSVDPGAMDAALMEGAGDSIEHFAMTAQKAGEELASRNAALLEAGQPAAAQFGVLVCDVNANARFIAQKLLLPLAPMLAMGAPLVLTLKLPKRATAATAVGSARTAEQLLGRWFERFEVMHLLGNTNQERTLIAFRCAEKAPPSAGPGAAAGGEHGVEWREYDVEGRWHSTLGRLVAWVEQHGGDGGGDGGGGINSNSKRLPLSDARERDERVLGQWVHKQQKQKAAPRGGWGETHIAALEAHSWWSWATEDEQFDGKLASLKAWVARERKLPDAFAAQSPGEEAHLAAWVAAQRRSRKKKRLSAARCGALEGCELWTWVAQFGSGDDRDHLSTLDSVLGPRFRCAACGLTCNTQEEMAVHGTKSPQCGVPAAS